MEIMKKAISPLGRIGAIERNAGIVLCIAGL